MCSQLVSPLMNIDFVVRILTYIIISSYPVLRRMSTDDEVLTWHSFPLQLLMEDQIDQKPSKFPHLFLPCSTHEPDGASGCGPFEEVLPGAGAGGTRR